VSVYKFSNAGGLKAKTVYTSFLAGNTAYVPPFEPSGAWDSIATTTLTTSTTDITFSSIPSTYKHLQIRFLAQSSNSATAADNLAFKFNSDTGGNYTRHYIDGSGSGVATYGANANVAQVYATCSQTSPTYSNVFGVGILDILDYSNTSKNKTTRAFSGVDFNGTGGAIQFTSGLWRNTAAITSINITALSGNLKQYSQFALYGIKGN
jgi:hypothetical protein